MYFIHTYAAVYTEWLLIPWTVQFILLQAPSALIFCYVFNILEILFYLKDLHILESMITQRYQQIKSLCNYLYSQEVHS